MKKVFRFFKGVAKGVRDVLPVPSKDAERQTESGRLTGYENKIEALGQKLTSRGVAVTVLLYLVDEIFKLGLFN